MTPTAHSKRTGVSFTVARMALHPSPAAPRVVIVVPAYNEAATIRDVVERCVRTGFPVIVVDDGSTDATAAIVADLPVALVRQPRNHGKGAALLLGIRHALRQGAARVITLDGD